MLQFATGHPLPTKPPLICPLWKLMSEEAKAKYLAQTTGRVVEIIGPFFEHDCEHCIHLGSEVLSGDKYDMYYCPMPTACTRTFASMHVRTQDSIYSERVTQFREWIGQPIAYSYPWTRAMTRAFELAEQAGYIKE